MLTATTTTNDMATVAAREAKRQFGRLIDTSQREPVTIEKHGHPIAVLLSKHDYDAIQEKLADFRAWKETAHLLSTEANRTALRDSIGELTRGDGIEKTLDDLIAHER